MGSTRLNTYAALTGFYRIRDEQKDALGLPAGAYYVPLMIQDRLFQADGSLLYPKAENGTHPVWGQEFFGGTLSVNGDCCPRRCLLRHLLIAPAERTDVATDFSAFAATALRSTTLRPRRTRCCEP